MGRATGRSEPKGRGSCVCDSSRRTNAAQCSAVQCSAVQRSAAQCGAAQRSAAQRSAVPLPVSNGTIGGTA